MSFDTRLSETAEPDPPALPASIWDEIFPRVPSTSAASANRPAIIGGGGSSGGGGGGGEQLALLQPPAVAGGDDIHLCMFQAPGDGGDGADRIQEVPAAHRRMVQDLQELMRALIASVDCEALSQLTTLMPQAQRDQMIALLRPLIAGSRDGRPNFDAATQARLTAALAAGRIPGELLAHSEASRTTIQQFLTTGLDGEIQRHELGPITRAMHQNVVGWLNRETHDMLRTWVAQSNDLPPVGSPLRIPPDVQWPAIVASLRGPNTPEGRAYINGLLGNSPLSSAVNFQINTEAGRNQLRTSLDNIALALQWRNATIPALQDLLNTSLSGETRNNLGWLAQQGLSRPGWAPTEGMDRQMWYSATGLRGEQARAGTSIVQIILAMRGMEGGADYPAGRDPFGPSFPGTVTRLPNGRLDVQLGVPDTLDVTPASELYYQRLQHWIDENRSVVTDFMRMFDNAHRQFGLLTFANVPTSNRAPNGELYNLACPRFTTRRVGDQIEVTQTTEYYNSPWWNAHDIFGSPVYTDPPPPREGDPPRQPLRVGLDDLVPVMTNSGLVLVRGRDLHDRSSDFWSGAWRTHHGSRAVGIGFDVAMCLNAGTRLLSAGTLLRAGATALERTAAREAMWLAVRQGAYNAALGGSSFLTSSWWQSTDRNAVVRMIPEARNLWFMGDMVRNLPGALRSIGEGVRGVGGALPLIRRLPWISGAAAAEAGGAGSLLENTIRASRWLHNTDITARTTATVAEVGLITLMAFGRHTGPDAPQAGDVIRFGNGRNLEQASQAFLSRFVSNIANGQRIAALDGIVEAVGRYRTDMPAADRDRLLTQLTATVDNTNAQPRERITAATALTLVLNREQQDGQRQLTEAQTQQLNKAKALLEQQMLNPQLAATDRLACGQGLLLTNSITPHAYANLCRQIAHDNNVDPAVRQQAVFGIGVCLMLTREMEAGIRDSATRSAYLARAFNTTAQHLEQELLALSSGQHNATPDMRVAALAMMHALNRDNRAQAQDNLTEILNWYHQERQPGQFAAHFAGRWRDQMTAAAPANATPENLRVWYENRLASAAALRVLAADAPFMQTIMPQGAVTAQQVRENLVDVARRAIVPEMAAQAILALGNLQGLTADQMMHVSRSVDRLLLIRPLDTQGQLALTIIQERLLAAMPEILQHAPAAERTRLLSTVAGMIDPARADGQLAAGSPELRAAAISSLLQVHAQQPLPAAVIRLIADCASYRPAADGAPPAPRDNSALVRQVAFEALRRMGYGTREAAGIDLNVIAQNWRDHDPDIALRMMATNWLQVAAQQALPTRQAITDAAAANPERPRVSTPVTSNADAIRRWLGEQFGNIINTATNPDGSIDGERPNVDPIEQLLNAFDVRRPDVFGVRPDVNGRFRDTPGVVVTPNNARLVDGALQNYVQQLNRLFTLAQTVGGTESEKARQAIFWIANGGWSEFPERYRDAIAIISVRVIEQLARGQNSAQARQVLESLVESNTASPEARLIALRGLRTIRDTASLGSYDGRYTALLENVFTQLVTQRPTGTAAPRHYALLQEVMHDLAFTSNLRSPHFLSRLEGLAGDNAVPTEVRRFANTCLGRVLSWSNATLHAWQDRPNPAGDTAQLRAQHLEHGIREPGAGDIRLVEAIFNSVRGLPFQTNDPRLHNLMALIWNPSESSLRAQIAACRAAFLVAPAADTDAATRQQIGQIQRLALLRLGQISEFGPRVPGDSIPWVFQQEARAMLNEIVFTAPTPAARTERQTLVNDMTARSRELRTGVGAVLTEVRSLLSSPLGQSLLGAGDAAEHNIRLNNLRAIAQNSAQLANIDTVSLLVQSLSDFRNGQFGPWRPNGPAFGQMEEQLSTILQNETADRRVSLAAAIHVLTSANPSPFSQAVTQRALDALVRISNTEVAANPLWRREAQYYVNMILSQQAYAAYRTYINQPDRPPALRPVQR